MTLIDWIIVIVPLMAAFGIAFYARRYVRSVADFMAGGRNAGRFLLCTAKSEMGAGAMSYVTGFEIFGKGGFAYSWWYQLSFPVTLLVTISGFVVYRYRQTRALTLQQFFEMRYSRRLRLVTGMMAFFAGVVNYGIIPLINSKFIVYFLDLPQVLHILSFTPPTYLCIMFVNLTISALMTTFGGQITSLVADCTEGMFSQIAYMIIAAVVLVAFFSWPHTRELLVARPPGESLVNPFDSFSVKDFNIWYVLMGLVITSYGTMAWQNSHGFNASAASPHESRMGGILGNWRGFAANAMKYALIVVALTYMAGHEAAMQPMMEKMPDPHTANQMRIPVALSQVLPVGIRGLFFAVILMGVFSTDGMQLHSWSSIFIQDILLPLRKRPLTNRQHLIALRLGVVGMALCAFLFGVFFDPHEYLAMWFSVTEAIYVGGAGACIVGGLYWSRGTTAGAWVGLLMGSSLSFGGLCLRNFLYVPLVTRWLPHVGLGSFASACYQKYPDFPLNGRVISFYACLIAVAGYVIVSLLTCRKPHNMDRLLNRGIYAVEADSLAAVAKPARKRFGLYNIVGITDQFTRQDRWITLSIFGWHFTWFLVFIVVTGLSVLGLLRWSNRTWADYYIATGIFLPLLIGIVTTVWFTIGCTRDLRVFFRRLKEQAVDVHDDGTVKHDEEPAEPGVAAAISAPSEPAVR